MKSSDIGAVCRPNQHVVGMVLHVLWQTQSVCGRTHVIGYSTEFLLNLDVKGWTIMSKLNFGPFTTATDAQDGMLEERPSTSEPQRLEVTSRPRLQETWA